MPSFSIHLYIAKKISEKVKIDKDLFYYGNLIPDVDRNCKISRYNAHYYDNIPYPSCPKENMINIDKFLNDYKEHIKNPLILGYYTHLLTDYFYNSIVYINKWVLDEKKNIVGIKLKNNKIKNIDIEDKYGIKGKYKHRDFELYGKYLYKYIKIPKDYEKIKNNINLLKNKFITEELIKQRLNYLNVEFRKFNKLSLKERIIKHNYKLFTKKELDILLDDCIKFILKKYKEIGID